MHEDLPVVRLALGASSSGHTYLIIYQEGESNRGHRDRWGKWVTDGVAVDLRPLLGLGAICLGG
jgi:hypothetical protein